MQCSYPQITATNMYWEFNNDLIGLKSKDLTWFKDAYEGILSKPRVTNI